MPRFATPRLPVTALLALTAALALGPLTGSAAPASATPVAPISAAQFDTAGTMKPFETYDWAEVYFGSGEIAQGQTLQVTVSDLRTGRIITANLGDGAVVVADIPAADRYGDTGFALTVPADFPLGVHNLTIGTDEFAPIVIPITVTAGEGAPPAEPTAPPATTDPAASSEPSADPESEAPGSATPGAPSAATIEPPVPVTAVYGVLGGIVGIIIITAIVRRVRKSES